MVKAARSPATKVVIRTDRGSTGGGTAGADGSGTGYTGISCSGRYCDGIRVTAEVRAITSAGKGSAGAGSVTYSAPYTVAQVARSGSFSGKDMQTPYYQAYATLPSLHNQVLAAGVDCTSWDERVESLYRCPDGSCYVYGGVVSATCKY